MGSDNIPFTSSSPLFGAFASLSLVESIILISLIAAGLFWWFREQGDNR